VEDIEELLIVKQQTSPIDLFAEDKGHVGVQADPFSLGIQKELDSEDELGVSTQLVGDQANIMYLVAAA
jgi:hypothetical protein